MRVIGGSLKGRRLRSVKGSLVRPTSDKVREAVFNILPMDFPFERVLDLFAGTGAMGIEAVSRGAGEAVFVDRDQAPCDVIRKNIEACGLAERTKVVRRDAIAALRAFSAAGERFDLVIIDPPYESGLTEEALRAVDEGGLLAEGGMVVAEASTRIPLDGAAGALATLELADRRRYGDTTVYFFRRREG